MLLYDGNMRYRIDQFITSWTIGNNKKRAQTYPTSIQEAQFSAQRISKESQKNAMASGICVLAREDVIFVLFGSQCCRESAVLSGVLCEDTFWL